MKAPILLNPATLLGWLTWIYNSGFEQGEFTVMVKIISLVLYIKEQKGLNLILHGTKNPLTW